MLAAAASADITPAPGPVLQGHYTTNPSTGVLHPLEARAAAFHVGERTVILITLDVIGVSLDTTVRIRQRIESALGVHPNNVMVCASHTHCAPATVDLLALTPDPRFLSSIEDAAVGCATEAASHLRPVKLALGTSSAHFNVNRRPLPGVTAQFSVNYGGICDKRVRVLQAVDGRHRPVLTLFHYACHPTTLPGSQGLISSDFPGVARGVIEQETGCPALFLPSTFANIRPLILDSKGEFAPATPDQLLDVGRQLAQATLHAAKHANPVDADLLDARERDLVVPFAGSMADEQLRAIDQETTPSAIAVKRPWARRLIEQRRAGGIPVSERSVMQLFRVGPLSLLSIPGEPVQEIGHSIERMAAGTHPDLWPVGYTNDMLGYLVTEQHKREGGYEPNAYPLFNRPAPFDNEQFHIERAAGKLLGV